MANDFKKGDVVVLKSGGPCMTVESINAGMIDCVWFLDKKTLRGSFPAEVLELKNTGPSLLHIGKKR